MDRRSLAREIYHRTHLTGEFKLRSGMTATEYLDKYRFESDPKLLRTIADALGPMIPSGTEILAGLELGGVPLAAVLSQVTSLPALFVRKKPKTYGTCRLAEGGDFQGRRLLIVEDVATTGGQIIQSTQQLRTDGAIVDHAIVVIDREQGGRENLAASNIELRALYSLHELRTSAV